MKSVARLAGALIALALLVTPAAATAAGGVKLCIPNGEGKPVRTPKAGACKPGYSLTELGAEGKQGPQGGAGPEGKAGPEGREGKAGGEGSGLPAQERQLLEAILPFVQYQQSGVGGKPTIRFSGANVQIVNGEGSTATTNGAGNLVIGYDEDSGQFRSGGELVEVKKAAVSRAVRAATKKASSATATAPTAPVQSGSHNLILGEEQEFTSYGGVVTGTANTLSAPEASVIGGFLDSAEGENALVGGGFENRATDLADVAIGGEANIASGNWDNAVFGGSYNEANGITSAVTGGTGNRAHGHDASVSGGTGNRAIAGGSSISGGENNRVGSLQAEKEAPESPITEALGGFGNGERPGRRSWIGGGFANVIEGEFAAIFGGRELTAGGKYEAKP